MKRGRKREKKEDRHNSWHTENSKETKRKNEGT